MKRFLHVSLIVLSILVAVGVFFGGPAVVSSSKTRVFADIPVGCPGSNMQGPPSPDSCPVCYERKPANYVQLPPPIVTTVKNCAGDPNFIQILQHERGHTMDARTCYIIQAGVAGITNGDPFGSDVCNAAEAARVDKGTPMNGDGTPTTQPAPGGSGGGGSAGGGGSGGSGGGPGGNAGQTSNGPVVPDGPDKDKIEKAKVDVTDQERVDARNCNGPADCISKNPLIKRLGLIFDLLSAVVGVAIVGTVIVGGIRYSASGGDPNAVAKAKKMIANALLAFVAYIFLYAFLQWLIPGGLF